MAEGVNPAAAETRSVLNAVASIKAGQDQMQQDVDKLRGQVNGLLILGLYTVALVVVVFLVVRFPKGGAAT